VPPDDELGSPPAVKERKQLTNGGAGDFGGDYSGNGQPTSGRPPVPVDGSKGMTRARKSSLSDLNSLPSGSDAYLTSARDTVKGAVNGAVNGAMQMVYNLAPEYGRSRGPSGQTSHTSSHTTSLQSSGVWSLDSSNHNTPAYGGLTFGGPVPGASAAGAGVGIAGSGVPTGYLLANSGPGGERPYSSVAALRAKKSTQPPKTPPSMAMASTVCCTITACKRLYLKMRLSL
jgi:hypothetical protein